MHRDKILPIILRMGCKDIDLFNLLVSYRDAAYGDTTTMYIYRPRAGKDRLKPYQRGLDN